MTLLELSRKARALEERKNARAMLITVVVFAVLFLLSLFS